MTKSKRNRPYQARQEYRAVQPLVESRLEEGYSIKLIFEELTSDGRLTISYGTFCDYVRGGGRRLHRRPKPPPVKPPLVRAIEIMESVAMRVDVGYSLRQIYQGLVDCGLDNFGYAAFYDFIRDDETLPIERIRDEDYLFTKNGGYLLLLEKLASFFEAESDSAGAEVFDESDSAGADFYNIYGESDLPDSVFLRQED